MTKPRKTNFQPMECSCCHQMADKGALYWSAGWALHPDCYDIWFPKDHPAPRKRKTRKVNDPSLEKCFKCQALYIPISIDDIYLCPRCYPR
jgi:hypothetical protein